MFLLIIIINQLIFTEIYLLFIIIINIININIIIIININIIIISISIHIDLILSILPHRVTLGIQYWYELWRLLMLFFVILFLIAIDMSLAPLLLIRHILSVDPPDWHSLELSDLLLMIIDSSIDLLRNTVRNIIVIVGVDSTGLIVLFKVNFYLYW